jgi:sugar lactone lactonase YvrE
LHRHVRCIPVLALLALAGCGSTSSKQTAASKPAPTASTSSGSTASSPFLGSLKRTSIVASTVPANGDVNPYGLAEVTTSIGRLKRGDLLVSNFNDKANNQGTGTTIMQISPSGTASLFGTISAAHLPGPCPGGVGLTTALNILPGGYVVLGSLPTTNGKSATAKAGCLIVLDSSGRPVETIAGPQIVGPWDMTAVSQGSTSTLFVSNALNGGAAKGRYAIKNSTVLRVRLKSSAGAPPKVLEQRVIAAGIPWRDDAEALVIGPTGLAVGTNGTLYLADTLANSITAIPEAMTRTSAAGAGGTTITTGGNLKQPLGLTIAPNGDILTSNAGDGAIVETTPAGHQVMVRTVDTKTGAGSLFGIAVAPQGKGLYFVDDGENSLRLLR